MGAWRNITRAVQWLGIALLIAGAVLLIVLPQFFWICADPGGCHTVVDSWTILPGAVVALAGIALLALPLLHRSTA